MALYTLRTAAYVRCCIYFTLSFFFIKNPSLITERPIVIVIGQAMRLDHGSLNEENSDITSTLAVLFGVLGFNDFTQLISKNHAYFEALIPARLGLAFGFAGYSYINSNSLLHNDFIFIYNFFEIWFNFMLYNVSVQEKQARIKKLEDRDRKITEKIVSLAEKPDAPPIDAIVSSVKREFGLKDDDFVQFVR